MVKKAINNSIECGPSACHNNTCMKLLLNNLVNKVGFFLKTALTRSYAYAVE